MAITRKQFLRLTFLVTGATVAGLGGALLPACSDSDEGGKPGSGSGGGDGGGGGGGRDGASSSDAKAEAAADSGGDGFKCNSAMSQNHGHTITILEADLDSTTAKTYAIRGTADHDHDVTLEPQDLADLKAGLSVKKTSTMGSTTHDHEVNIVCV